mmetsp:Transcript_49352/g.104997  ORF Transcript_49352/g.104997 Transcript_49352/m.104997 type:complete len:238 (-) Transcript_49352:283-996(-)
MKRTISQRRVGRSFKARRAARVPAKLPAELQQLPTGSALALPNLQLLLLWRTMQYRHCWTLGRPSPTVATGKEVEGDDEAVKARENVTETKHRELGSTRTKMFLLILCPPMLHTQCLLSDPMQPRDGEAKRLDPQALPAELKRSEEVDSDSRRTVDWSSMRMLRRKLLRGRQRKASSSSTSDPTAVRRNRKLFPSWQPCARPEWRRGQRQRLRSEEPTTSRAWTFSSLARRVLLAMH